VMTERLEVHLVTPQREVWSGEGTLVVARGTEGELGVQRGHVPMLIRLDIGVLRVMRGSEELLKAVVDGGFMHVTTSPEVTRVDVMADDAEFAHEIDVRAAEQARAEAQARIERNHDERAQADLKKALVRLAVNG
jgi:F-type H+-transporting ATPase subunit epsilon